MELCKKYMDGVSGDVLYLLFRFLVGGMFFMHGSGKLFGWFGGPAIGFKGLMGFVGAVEFLVGLAIVFGFLTRLAAFGGLVIMAAAYITGHMPKGWNPLANQGELALLFLAAFLVLKVYGARRWAVERLFWKEEVF